jgi:hypothetical protein
MRKKILGIFVCMLVMTAAVVSAAGIINIATPRNVDNHLNTDTIEKESNEESLIKEEQDPQPLATKTGYLSIPAAAFTPTDDTTSWHNTGTQLHGQYFFIAPVYLLNGATVTKVTFHWRDDAATYDGVLTLTRNNMDGSCHQLASTPTSGNSGYGISYDDTIDYALIDNSIYSYHFVCTLDTDIWLNGVIIEYNYEPESVPVNVINDEESQVSNVAVK